MLLKNKIIILTVIPLLAVIAVIGVIVAIQSQRLAGLEARVIEESLLNSRRAELNHYVHMATTAIDHLQKSGLPEAEAQARAKDILRAMNYGDDGYFFAYQMNGVNLVHPRQPQLEGQNLWEMRDPKGMQVIRDLIETARNGGGYLRYQWQKPSTGLQTDKLAYVVTIKRWGWMMGTGIYLDDVEEATHRIRDDVAANIRSTMVLLVAVAVVSMLILVAGGVALNISEHRLADQRLRELAQRIVTSQEDERARLSRELHDGISQVLVSIKYQFELAQHHLESAEGDPAHDLREGIQRLSGAIAEVRHISHDLRPTLLDDLGLSVALDQLAKDFARHSGITISAETELGDKDLSKEAALTLFRIAQEALTNVERHSRASEAHLHLVDTGRELQLIVSDNGVGFDAQRVELDRHRGIGLRNMRERVEYLGGQLTISSRPGNTEVVAAMPWHASVIRTES